MKSRLHTSLRTSVIALATAAAASSALAAELKVSIDADPAMIDPITYSELLANRVIKNMYESLTAVDADGEVVPGLAESWEALDGGLGFRFRLRPGVKFHSGRELTAKDVKFSYEQLLLPGNKGGLNSNFLNDVVGAEAVKSGAATELEGVKVIDDLTVEVHFTQPDVLFPIYPIFILDSGIVEEAGPEWFNTVSAGTGPFKFEQWLRGQEVDLAANPDYWGGAPTLDGVRFIIVPSPETAVSLFETGELDIMLVPDGTMRRVKSDPALAERALTASRAQVRYLAMNEALYEPFKDVRVREAICLSLEQQAMIDGLYDGNAVPLYGQIAQGTGGYNPDLAPIEYNPERAKQLFAEAGYADGAGLPPVKLATTEPNKNQHLYFASQFAEILGWPVEVEIVERGAHLSSINSGQTPFFAWGWTADYPDGMNFLDSLWPSASPYNRGWKNAEFDALIDKAKITADDAERYAIYHEAESMLLAGWATCPLPVAIQMVLVAEGVEGVELTATDLLPFANVTKAD